jgi:hypothetical protein
MLLIYQGSLWKTFCINAVHYQCMHAFYCPAVTGIVILLQNFLKCLQWHRLSGNKKAIFTSYEHELQDFFCQWHWNITVWDHYMLFRVEFLFSWVSNNLLLDTKCLCCSTLFKLPLHIYLPLLKISTATITYRFWHFKILQYPPFDMITYPHSFLFQ